MNNEQTLLSKEKEDEIRRYLNSTRRNWGHHAEDAALLLAQLDAERARADAAEERLQDAVFNCPSCGRHDFGLHGPTIGHIRAAEARADALEKELETLTTRTTRFQDILGESYQTLMGRGKIELRRPDTIREAVAQARDKCPLACDVIASLLFVLHVKDNQIEDLTPRLDDAQKSVSFWRDTVEQADNSASESLTELAALKTALVWFGNTALTVAGEDELRYWRDKMDDKNAALLLAALETK